MSTYKKEQLIAYVESIIRNCDVDNIEVCKTFDDEVGETQVWLVEMEDGEEYWLVEGAYPTNIYRRSGIYQDVTRVYETHKDLSTVLEDEVVTLTRDDYLIQ